MAYLNLDPDYFEHPKTMRLIGLLGRGAEVLPIRLWAYCGKYAAQNGKLTGYRAQEIESLLHWVGEKGKAIEALIACGFVEKEKDGYAIHDWKDHEGHIWAIKQRNKKVAKNRWKNMRNKLKNNDSTVDTNGSTTGTPKSTKEVPQSVPFQSVPERTLTKAPLAAVAVDKPVDKPPGERCEYREMGRRICRLQRDGKSKYCYDHKLKVEELHFSKQPNGLAELKDMI